MKKFIALAMVIVMALAITLPAFANPLVDVPDTHWAAEAVEKLTTLGIITGYTDDTFRGQQNITRYEVAVMIDRFLTYLEDLMDDNQEAVIDIIDSRIMNIITPDAGENVSWLERVIIQNMDAMDEEKWNAVQSELDTLSNRVEELEVREIPYDSLVEIVQDIVNSSAGSDPSLRGEIEKLEAMVNDLQEAQGIISVLQKEIDGLRSDLNRVSANAGNNNDFLTLSGRISYIETQVEALKNLGDTNAALTNEVSALSNTLKDLQNAVSALQRNATMASSDILTLSGRISYLEQQLANQPTNAADAAELANLSNRLRTLENQVANMPQDSAITTLANDYLALSGRISYLEGKYAAQGDGNAALAAEIETLKNKLNDLAALNQTGSTTSTSPEVMNDLAVLNDKILSLEKKVDNKLGELGYKDSNLATEMASVKAEINELNATVVGILEENGEVDLNSTLYNMLLTMSGRLSYLEGKMATVLETESAVSANLKTINDQLLTLSGRMAYIEAKFANFNPSDIKDYSSELASLKNELNAISAVTQTSSVLSPELANDITVLNSKIIELDRKLNNLGASTYTGETVQGMVSVLDDRIANVATQVESLGLDETFAPEVQAMKADIASIESKLNSQAVVDPSLANDITVLNTKIIELDRKLNSLDTSVYTREAVQGMVSVLDDRIVNVATQVESLGLDETFAPEVQALKTDIASIESKLNSQEAVDPSLANDITVLSAKIIELDRKLNNLNTTGYTGEAVQVMISALDDKIANVATQVESLGLDETFAAEVQGMKADIASIESKLNSQAVVDPSLANDITVLNDKVLALDAKLNLANDKIAEAGYADSNLKNDVAAISKELDAINSYVASLAVEDGTIIFDSKAYDYFLTLSGRISYLEGKIANLTAVDPKITDDVAVLAANVDGIVSQLEANGGYGYDPTLYNDIFVLNTKVMSLEDKVYQQSVADKAMASEIAELNARIKALEIEMTMSEASLSEKIDAMAEAMRIEAANNENNAQFFKNVEFANDITVLSDKVLQLEKAVNSMGATNIVALEHRMNEVGDKVSTLQGSTFVSDENLKIELTVLKNSVDSLTRQLGSLSNTGVEVIPTEQLNDVYAKVAELEAEMAKVMAALEENVVSSSSSVSDVGNNDITITIGGDDRFVYDRIVLIESNVSNLEKLISDLRAEMIAGDQHLADEIAKLASLLADFMFDMNNEMNLKSDAADVIALADRVAAVEAKLADIENVDLEALKAEIAALWDAMDNLKVDDSAYIVNDITVLADRIGKLEDKLHYVSSSDLATLRKDFVALQATMVEEDEKNQDKFNSIGVLLSELDSQIAEIPVDDHLYFVNDIMVLNDKINKLEKQFTNEIAAIKTRLADLTKLENTVAEMGEALELLGVEFREELDALDARVTALELGQQGLTQKLGDVTGVVNNHEVRITALEDEVASLNKLINRVKISGDNELKFQHLYLNYYGSSPGLALESPFDYHNMETYDNESKISNTTNLLVTFNPENGVKFELGMSLVLDDLFFSTKKDHANQFTLENSKINLSIVGDKVVASLYGGDIRDKMPTTFTDYTLNTAFFAEDVYDKYEDYASNMDFATKYETVAGITGDVKFFNDTLTISSLLGKIVPEDYEYDNIGGYQYLYGVAGVFAPTENVNVGIRTVGDFYLEDRINSNLTLFKSTVYGADFSVKFLEKLKASGEFAYFMGKHVPSQAVVMQGSAMQFNVTAGLEPGLVVSGDFERIADTYLPSYVTFIDKEDNHHVEGMIVNDIMNVGATVKLPKVIGFTLSGKLDFKGDYDWQDRKERVETLTLTYEPRLSTNNYLKLTAQAARTNDILDPTNQVYKTMEYLGKIEYERAFMTFVASYTREDDIINDFPGTNLSNVIEAHAQFNIVKDIVTLKGGLKLEYGDFANTDPLVHQKYYAEALVKLNLGKSVELDIAGKYYMSAHADVNEANKNDYTQLKASTTLGWNITNSTKLNVGLSAETRAYQMSMTDVNRPLHLRDGFVTTVSVGVEQKVFTSTTIGVGYNFKYNKLAFKTSDGGSGTIDNEKEFSVNEFVFNVKTVF